MEKKKIMRIACIAGVCVPMWIIFFSFGIMSIWTFLLPILFCLTCWGVGILYNKLTDKADGKKKVVITVALLMLLGVVSVLFFSEGKDIIGKIVGFLFPVVIGGAVYGGEYVANKYGQKIERKKVSVISKCMIIICIAIYALFVLLTIGVRMFGAGYDVNQLVVYGIIFFCAGWIYRFGL